MKRLSEIIEQRSFIMREGNSDKVYHISIIQNSKGSYDVPFRYGRRELGYDNLKPGHKVCETTFEEASTQFNKMVREKERKGYIMLNNPEELEVYNTLAY